MISRTLRSPAVLLLALSLMSMVGSHSAMASVSQPSVTTNPAERLQKRIRNRFGLSPSLPAVIAGMQKQRQLLQASTLVQYRDSAGAAYGDWAVRTEEHATWLHIEPTPEGPVTTLDPHLMAPDILSALPEQLRHAPKDAVLSTVTELRGVPKATTDTAAHPGFVINPQTLALQIMNGLMSRQEKTAIAVSETPGKIVNATGQDLGALTLLSTGKSNFAGSGDGRKFNVRKGLSQHLHNTLVPPGVAFSFNSVVKGVPIGEWKMALGIFNGDQLRPVPGGGLCQVATTMFRAALQAGLPVTKRASHSLFVHYYEKYGVGIDATVFPGAQDLVMQNDTGNWLLIQAYTEGDEARVHVYGTDDGRRVTMKGPYFSVNTPEEFPSDKGIKGNEIGWERDIRYSDGRMERSSIISRYKSIPRSVVKEYTTAPVLQELSYLGG